MIIFEEGSIYGEEGRKKVEKRNRWDIIVTRLSFDFIPNHYCPSARDFRGAVRDIGKESENGWWWTLITFPDGRLTRVITSHRVSSP